ncbi:hypothetical protein [Fuerstiella marisgermanici]|uniref:Uncharacterized protein n=1 Tax=Fuerstiella marisgermanici TaxID=1891926 RepID=A0A1P8WBI1_9PLAN|nr:hypothetical protein [Fuerstiella marisgermanici]APZ91396.1 hypothetical protein Fuma_00984 [Fuerstiella marisgermanici]
MTRPFILFLLPLAFAVGCSEDNSATTAEAPGVQLAEAPSEDTAEASVRYIMEGVKNGQPVVAWNALPTSYQKDITGIVQKFGETMDPQVWGQITGLIKNVHELLVEKQDFIAGHPMVAQSGDPATTKEAIAQVTNLLKTVLDSAGDLENLKTFDGAEFMKTTGADLLTQFDALSKLAPPGSTPGPIGLAALENAKVETLESTDTTAKLKITTGDNEQVEDYTKVDGKWLPVSLTKDWDQQVADANQAIAELPNSIGQIQQGVGMASGILPGLLAPLKAAETQEQFNAAVNNLQQSAMMMMGGMGGRPPSGGPPASDSQSSGSQSDPVPEPAKPPEE